MFFTKKIMCFFRLASTKSYRRAAEELYVTPEAVKYSIAILERDYGQSLFVKNNYEIHLTKEGEDFYKKIKPLYDEINTTLHNLQISNGKRKITRIKIDGFYTPHISHRINNLSKVYNGKIIVTQSDYSSLDDLKNNICSISICTFYGSHLPAENKIKSLPLSHDCVGLLANKKIISKYQNNEDLILNEVFYQRSGFLEQELFHNIHNRLSDSGYYPNFVGLADVEDVLNMIRFGSGVTMLTNNSMDYIENKDELCFIANPFSFEIKVSIAISFKENATNEIFEVVKILHQQD